MASEVLPLRKWRGGGGGVKSAEGFGVVLVQ